MSESTRCDQQAWVSAALTRHESGLIRFAVRLCGHEETARDAVQETFLHLCREDPAKLNGRLAPWLYTVCRNRLLDQQRKHRREIDGGETSQAKDVCPQPDPARIAAGRDRSDHVLRRLDELPANQRNVIRLRFHGGLSYQEIAAITELSVSNVGFLIHTAIKTIRERMKD